LQRAPSKSRTDRPSPQTARDESRVNPLRRVTSSPAPSSSLPRSLPRLTGLAETLAL